MRVSEILRKLADIVDAEADIEGEPEQPVPTAAPEPVAQVTSVSGQMATDAQCDDTTDDANLGPMVSPLQQEHELLKKSQGVENNVDDFAEDEGYENDLAALKDAAGIRKE